MLFVLGIAAFFSYTEPLLTDNNFTEIEKNTTMYIRIIFSLIWFLITGKLSDVMGRKITLILDKLLFLSGEILLLISVFNHWIFLTGISWGMVFAGCWGFMNLNITATNEIIPTKLRSSAVGLSSLISYGFSVSAFLILPFILESTENFALLYVICMPFTIALILVISFKYKETVGVDMEKIKE
ncbi:MAG: MFS transporter [archaeon]|nr:MFS transporter [archaeon]